MTDPQITVLVPSGTTPSGWGVGLWVGYSTEEYFILPLTPCHQETREYNYAAGRIFCPTCNKDQGPINSYHDRVINVTNMQSIGLAVWIERWTGLKNVNVSVTK